MDAGAEHHHHRLFRRLGGGVDEGKPKRLRPRRRRPRADPLVQIRDGVCHHPPVGQRVSRSRWCLRPVGVDHEAAVGAAADVAAVQEQLVSARHLDAAGGPEVTRVGEQQLSRQDTAGQRDARAIKVGQHGVEQPGALQQTGFQRVPIRRGDHQRQRVEAPRPRLRRAVPVRDDVAVSIDLDVRDAVVVDRTAYHRPQLVEPATAAFADALGQLLPGRADIACGVDEFVVPGARAATQVEERLLSPGGAVPGQQIVDVGCALGG